MCLSFLINSPWSHQSNHQNCKCQWRRERKKDRKGQSMWHLMQQIKRKRHHRHRKKTTSPPPPPPPPPLLTPPQMLHSPHLPIPNCNCKHITLHLKRSQRYHIGHCHWHETKRITRHSNTMANLYIHTCTLQRPYREYLEYNIKEAHQMKQKSDLHSRSSSDATKNDGMNIYK